MFRRQFCIGALAGTAAAAASTPLSAAVNTEIRAVTGDGAEKAIERVVVDDLRKSLRGGLLLPTDDGYDKARKLWSGIDKKPALIARCTGPADVRTAVNFAREHDLLTAVKCGGHNAAGKGSCDNGIMIDLSPLQGIRVEPDNGVSWVAGGSLLGAMDHENMAHGVVTTAGTVSHTGVGGLTLGGGFGRVGRRFGLAADNIKAVEIVTADGQFRRANAQTNEDLYWGCRGGGGNFGVVTAFQFAVHPMQREVVGGSIVFPFDNAGSLIEFYGEHCANAPDELATDMYIVAPPNRPRVVVFSVCYSGDVKEADRYVAPLRKLGKPINDGIRKVDYVQLQRSADNEDPRNVNNYTKGGFCRELPAELARALADNLEPHAGRTGIAVFQQSGGAINRVEATATAFAHRYAEFNMFIAANWVGDDQSSEHIAWGRSYWKSIEPFIRGAYVNDLREDSAEAINRSYLGNYDRLVQVKNKYDPTNLFRLNANIKPTVAT